MPLDRITCPAPLSDAAKQALKEILQQFSPKDRGVLRQLLDRARPAETSSSAEGGWPWDRL
jgi:hypothetical protein